MFLIAPLELIPVPEMVMFSPEVMSLEMDTLAPSATIVAPSVVPRALL